MSLSTFLDIPLNKAIESMTPNVVALVDKSLRKLEILILQENNREK